MSTKYQKLVNVNFHTYLKSKVYLSTTIINDKNEYKYN